MPRKRKNDPQQNNGSDDGDGEIRIFKRESNHYHLRRDVLTGILARVFILMAFLITAMLMKNYTDRKVAESVGQLTREANSFSELERWVYSRESFRRVYDGFTPYLTGIAASKEAFESKDYNFLTTGIIIDGDGNILAPSRILKGRTTAYVRIVTDGVEEITEAGIIGFDDATGVGLISVPALAGKEVPRTTDHRAAPLETMIHLAMPTGDSESAGVALSGIQTVEAPYSLGTGQDQTSLQVFSLHNPINAQTDGGAILDMDGNLIGMASLKLSRELKVYPYVAGIPTEELKAIRDRIHRGEYKSLSFGISGTSVTNDAIEGVGYYVLEVTPRSTADRGGLRPTDIIISINNQPFEETRTIDSYLIGRRIGSEIQLKILQGNEIKTLEMRIY